MTPLGVEPTKPVPEPYAPTTRPTPAPLCKVNGRIVSATQSALCCVRTYIQRDRLTAPLSVATTCDRVKRFEWHMVLAEWLVHWAPKLASRVQCSTKSSP